MKNYVNLMEELVEVTLNTMVKDLEVCDCETCKGDIIALALNKLPAKYCSSSKGLLYLKLDTFKTQYRADVVRAITEAADIVKQYPRH